MEEDPLQELEDTSKEYEYEASDQMSLKHGPLNVGCQSAEFAYADLFE